MRFVVLLSAFAMLTASIAVAAPKPLTKEAALKVMHERHEGMETVGKTNKALRRALEATPADLATVKVSAAKLADLSRRSSGWFPKGTGPELGKTGAKPEIWQTPSDFAAKLRDFQGATKALNSAAASGDLSKINARYADLGKTCKACHDTYRSEMHH